VELVGTAGISSDEQLVTSIGQPRQYAIFEKPWRSDALCTLYRHLDLVHAVSRNPNGNPIRTRVRTLQVRQRRKVPPGLPRDCYSDVYLDNCTVMQRELIDAGKPYGVKQLLAEVQRLASFA
jgi:hypothetical protein